MDKVESAYSKLEQASKLLDEVACDLRDIEFLCQAADTYSIADALASIMDVKLAIYKERPELKPEYLEAEVPDAKANRQFGRIMIQSERLLSQNKSHEAVELFLAFLESNPPSEFIEMANSEIERINELFSK